MNLHFTTEPDDMLVVHLKEAEQDTTVDVRPAKAGLASLLRAMGAAVRDGYGECFWPGATTGGQYWWIVTRRDETVEVIVMWTRGGASQWEHVFRATDSVDWVRERVRAEFDGLGLTDG
jgi:hypothetical protein